MATWLDADPVFASRLGASQRIWLVTGAAGFIGSHLVEALLGAGQIVRGLDNFATGHRRNLDDVRRSVGQQAWRRFTLIEGDIRDLVTCAGATADADIVLHQAALGSVPRSIADPLTSNDVNVAGFLAVLDAARRAGVRRFVYAASSSTYGDEPALPKREDRIGNPLSPYAVTKLVNELYAGVHSRVYGFHALGLRYFNVFGPRQDPDGPYAAVIPRWAAAMIEGRPITINGDGETSRDFCFVVNAVQANLRAALREGVESASVYNVAAGAQTSLNDLFGHIRQALAAHGIHYRHAPVHGPFREGDVRHSLADIRRAGDELGYRPSHDVSQGLVAAMDWYVATGGMHGAPKDQGVNR